MEDIILRYLEKEMGPEEQLAFEKRLDQEPELAQMMEEEVRARVVVTASAYLDRKTTLKARPLAGTSVVKPIFAQPTVWAIAAVVVLLLAFAAIQVMNQPINNEELFAQHYKTVPFEASRGGNGEAPFLKAKQAYEQGDYQQTILQLEVLLADNNFSARPQAYYFQGLSHIELNDMQAAIESFDHVAEGSVYGPSAQWHIALSYLKTDNQLEAKKALQRLLEGPVHTYQAQARMLLDSLD